MTTTGVTDLLKGIGSAYIKIIEEWTHPIYLV